MDGVGTGWSRGRWGNWPPGHRNDNFEQSNILRLLYVSCCGAGVRPWLPSNPLAALDLHSHHDAGDGDGGDGDYAPPAPCYEDPKQLPKAQPATPLRAFGDDPRVVTELVPAPVGALVATADALGRVSLVDGAALLLLRMWKVRALLGRRGAAAK